MNINTKINTMQFKNTISNVSKPNEQTSQSLTISGEEKIDINFGRTDGVEVELRGISDEEQLYYDSWNEYSDIFRNTYVDGNDHFKGYGIEEMVSKFDEAYKLIDDSDLSDKDKEIKKFALADSFSMHSFTFSNRMNGEILTQSSNEQLAKYKEQGNSYKGSDEQLEDKKYSYALRQANTEIMMKLRSFVLDYYKNTNKENDIFSYLEDNGVSAKKIDEYSKGVSDANKIGTAYDFSKEETFGTYTKDDVKSWIRGSSAGFEEMKDKYLKEEML